MPSNPPRRDSWQIPAASQRFDAQGNLTDEAAKKLIGQLVQNLANKARQMHRQPAKAAA